MAITSARVALGEENGHRRQRVDIRFPRTPQRLPDVLGMHDDLAEVGRVCDEGAVMLVMTARNRSSVSAGVRP